MAESCETPLVIGLYGTWGIGKTSMMRQIQAELDANKVETVWFDPWQHQFDENPVLALLHTALRDLDENTREHLKGTLISLAAALSSVALNALTNQCRKRARAGWHQRQAADVSAAVSVVRKNEGAHVGGPSRH
jgi:predicted KAP-like P-loop ATPase